MSKKEEVRKRTERSDEEVKEEATRRKAQSRINRSMRVSLNFRARWREREREREMTLTERDTKKEEDSTFDQKDRRL